MNSIHKAALAAAIFGVSFCATGFAAEQSSATKGNSASAGKISSGDSKFVMEAAKAGAAEVELGQLATSKAASPEVRQFAGKMVQDHGKAGAELKKIAAAKNMQVDEKLDAQHQKQKEKLEKLSGNEFDLEYMKIQREDHRKAVDLFKQQSTNGKDPELKQFAATTLPTLEEHKKMADGMQEKGTAKKR